MAFVQTAAELMVDFEVSRHPDELSSYQVHHGFRHIRKPNDEALAAGEVVVLEDVYLVRFGRRSPSSRLARVVNGPTAGVSGTYITVRDLVDGSEFVIHLGDVGIEPFTTYGSGNRTAHVWQKRQWIRRPTTSELARVANGSF